MEVPGAKIGQRFSCKTCNFRTTNDDALKNHVIIHHQSLENETIKVNRNTKRIHCKICEKKFNKKETFDKHMKSVHKKTHQLVTQPDTGRSTKIGSSQEYELQSRETTRKEE